MFWNNCFFLIVWNIFNFSRKIIKDYDTQIVSSF
jgi:hypothetical protein